MMAPTGVTEPVPTSRAWRMKTAMWRQRRAHRDCPDAPRLDGSRALVTGGGRGIGLETTRGLAARGAEVVSASRSAHGRDVPAAHQALDLADLDSVRGAVDDLSAHYGPRSFDVLVANAGLWPTHHGCSAQGHEIAFATNVLGHHALIRGLQQRDVLAPDARVVFVTGDIYVLDDGCTPDYRYRGRLGGQQAYSRSKLGNLWQAREFARRFPALRVFAVHPGVVASELAGRFGERLRGLMARVMLTPAEGAQTTLRCVTDAALPSGSYVHNVLGPMTLAEDDPGADAWAAAALYERLETLSAEGTRAGR